MYNHIYIEMDDAILTALLDCPVLMDLSGNIIVEADGEKPKHFGLPVTWWLIHPDYLLFMGEMGINTNQKEDGHVGNENFLCEKGTTLKFSVSMTDHHCTIILIVAASGEAVCCVMIVQSDSESPICDWCLGIDITVIPENDDNGNLTFGECNLVEEKYRPGGPTCSFHSKEIKTMFFVSPSSGVSAEILVKFCKILMSKMFLTIQKVKHP